MNIITRVLVLCLIAGCGLLAPRGLRSQEPDSLSLEEILRGGRGAGASTAAPSGSVIVTTPRNRRLNALETFRNASAGFDLEAWIASRRSFLQSVRQRFGLEQVELPSTYNERTPGDTGTSAAEPGGLREGGTVGAPTGAPRFARPAPVVRSQASTERAAGAPTMDLVLQMVDEATDREELLLDLLLHLDARLERLERAAGTLPAGLSSEQLRRSIRERVPPRTNR